VWVGESVSTRRTSLKETSLKERQAYKKDESTRKTRTVYKKDKDSETGEGVSATRKRMLDQLPQGCRDQLIAAA